MQSSESQTQLTSFENRIALPGCEIHSNGLVIAESVTTEQLAQIKGTLKTINESGLWWWGDFLNFCEFKRGLTYEAIEGESGYASESLRKAKRVSAAFEIGTRVPLSWHHHLDALNECQGNALKAIEWLKKAAKNNWSISEMRKQMRDGEAEFKDKDKGQPSVIQWVQRIKVWFKSKPTQQQAAALLPEMVAATEQCRAIAEAR